MEKADPMIWTVLVIICIAAVAAVIQFNGGLFTQQQKGRPVEEAELDEFKSWHAATALPRVRLVVGETGPAAPQASRIGGRPWLPNSTRWPLDKQGAAQNFLAQLNFANTPRIEDFPARGLLLFFISKNAGWSGDHDDDWRGDTTVIYVPEPDTIAGQEVAHPEAERVGHRRRMFPFIDGHVFESGRAVSFQKGYTQAPLPDWQMDAWHERFAGRPGDEAFDKICDAIADRTARAETEHYFGGHAQFTQDDPRSLDALKGYDRVLLKLGFDDAIMFGDAGQANFIVRRDDLLARDFSKYMFTWDCC